MISIVYDMDRAQWESLCKVSGNGTWFQTPQCFDFYSELSFLEAFAVGVEEDGCLKAVIVGYIQKDGGAVKSFLSRRAIINGGPAIAEDISPAALAALLKACTEMLERKAIYIETRNFNDYSRFASTFAAAGFQYRRHYNFHIDTTDMETLEGNLGKSRKRDIRTSFRDGATVVEDPSGEQVEEYLDILEELYATKVKTPLFPREFFRKLADKPYGKLLLVCLDGHVVGGTVCVEYPGKAVYEWFACGRDGVFKNIFPSTVATFSGMKYAAEHSCPRFDMMGAGAPGDGGYGVRDFKAKFGGTQVEHGRFLYVCKPLLYRIGVWGVKILKRK